VGDGLQYLKDRLPGDVTLTNPRHPLVGRVVRAESVHCWNGGVWLVVAHPDGRPARVRVEETDLVGGEEVDGAAVGSVVSVAGLRQLRALLAGRRWANA
jgi:hypothetical protein